MARRSTTRKLPNRANLEHFKSQAKKLLSELRRDDATAKLTTAQALLAQSYGLSSWRKLKAHVESVQAAEQRASKNKPRNEWKHIMDAAYVGDVPSMRNFLAEGADPNVVSTTGHRYRPLHRAIELKRTYARSKKHEQVVELLLEAGADPTLRATFEQVTALYLAASGETRFVSMLIDRFKPLDMHHACVCLDSRRVTALLKKDPSAATRADESGRTPLHACAASAMFKRSDRDARAQLRIAELLIDHGADVNGTYFWNGTKSEQYPIPVLYPVCGVHDNVALAELLLQHGANPCDGESVYHASEQGHDACLAVIARFADAKLLAAEASYALRTQLHWGCTRGVDWLLAHGADPNVPDKQTGNTALHEAAHRGSNKKVIAALLDHGASLECRNRNEHTPADVARKAGRTRVVEQFEKLGI